MNQQINTNQIAPATKPSAPVGHNQNMKPYKVKLKDIFSLINQSEQLRDKHELKLYEAIAKTYELGLELMEENLVKMFHQNEGEPYRKKSIDNPFHGIVTIVFRNLDREDAKSKYRKILCFAHRIGLSHGQLLKSLQKDGIESTYKNACAELDPDFEGQYIEDDGTRLKRSLTSLAGKQLCSPIDLSPESKLPVEYSGYCTAIVRIQNRQLEVIDFAPDQTRKSIQTVLTNLVDPEGNRTREKLKSKNLYWLFTLADIFQRFAISSSEANDMNNAARTAKPMSKHLKDETFDPAAFIREIKSASVTEKSGKFQRKTMLRFTPINGRIVADTISTLPSFPIVRFEFDAGYDQFNPTTIVGMNERHSNRLSREFLWPGNLTLAKSGTGVSIVSDADDVSSIPISPFNPANDPWRELPSNIKTSHPFEMNKADLFGLREWRSHHRQKKLFTRNEVFPKFMDILQQQDLLALAFPRNNLIRMKLGTLQDSKPIIGPMQNKSFCPRRIPFKQFQLLANLAQDYELTFEASFLLDQNGPSAIQFKAQGFHCDMTIILPLVNSKHGNTVEIATLI